MRLLLTLLIFGLPLAEIAAFIQVGQWLGLGPTLALVLLAGVAGILLIRHQSLATLGAVRAALARNQVPAAELADAVCVLIVGFLLILLGFISDIVAILLLVRPLRRAIFRWIGWRGSVVCREATIIVGEYHEIVEPGPGDPPAPNAPVSRWGGAQ